MKKISFPILFTYSLTFALAWNAQAVQFESSEFRTPLVELYTSEGCSSCPPADRWLSKFAKDSKLWKEYVPVAFHVDYWDYIGWKDPFAKSTYSERQRQYAREGGSTAIYTPGVRKAGVLWETWRLPLAKPSLEDTLVGSLQFSLNGERQIFAKYERSGELNLTDNLTLHVALLGLGLETDVKRGENRGKRLAHDFVVLELVSFESSKDEWQGILPATTTDAPQYAVAAWVSPTNRLLPIQATGGFVNITPKR
ncbi:MAG: DUF1223 domain-containing protein [Pseudomonadota bacterium]